nr:MAG TPA: hypothetical protein [Caudoviricetes sp.]
MLHPKISAIFSPVMLYFFLIFFKVSPVFFSI